jgi:omega-amidase
MSKLKICLVQTSLFWEDREANLNMFTQKIREINSEPDLIVLPEMFASGFTMNPKKNAEDVSGPSVLWLKETARTNNCVITGSLVIEEKGRFYNRLFWMKPDGSYDCYNKRHLFSLAGEGDHYESGNERIIVHLKGFKIIPLICYDLRFPVWSRNDVGYDLAIYVANWPERRSFFWRQLLIARAIENQAFVIGVNRVGNDGNGVYHSGDSICLGPLGNEIATSVPGKEHILEVVITKEEIESTQNKFKFLNDRDDFEVVI